ncbi:hypothetical protein QJS66_16500 [Kocuria rhizophila]|nr:hypothetical protein QJS66_16500 [Kocuria rhizophila]
MMNPQARSPPKVNITSMNDPEKLAERRWPRSATCTWWPSPPVPDYHHGDCPPCCASETAQM